MSFLKSKPEARVNVTVSAPMGAEENVKQLIQNLTAKEVEILRKVAVNPALKAMALNVAKQYV